ncbi:GNAT family N-acetyltransferase [Candidatus Omnitrophota bacterium]
MLEIIQNEDKFYSMRNDWNSLLEKSGINNPYLTHEWLSSWWKAYKDNNTLNIAVFKQQGQIIGAIPLVLSKETILGIPIKVIKFFSDHWSRMDFILAENKAECVTEFFNWFHSAKTADVLILSRIPEVSENAGIIEQVARNRKFNYKKTGLKNTVILLQGSWEDYLKQLTKKFRYEIRNKKRTLFGLVDVKYERITEIEDADTILPSLVEVGIKSWKYKDAKGIVVSNQGMQFYREIISEWGITRKLDISLLKQNNKPIAFAFRVKYKDTFYALETAYSQDYYNYSPGLVVNSILLEKLFEEKGANKYELGIMTDTKKRWTSNYDPEVKLNIYNKTLKMRTLFRLRELAALFSKRAKQHQ